MAQKTRRARRGATTYASDEKLIAYLAKHSPEILQSTLSEREFADVVDCILALPLTDQIRHFYCRPCGEYHLKTHPHHAEMTARKTKTIAGKTSG
jgi:hypothetical protein